MTLIEEDIKDFNYDENSRFIKSEFGDRFAWYDLLNSAFLIKGIKNAKFDITIPYKYQGQQKDAFVPLSTSASSSSWSEVQPVNKVPIIANRNNIESNFIFLIVVYT